jgi:hypothetical protein
MQSVWWVSPSRDVDVRLKLSPMEVLLVVRFRAKNLVSGTIEKKMLTGINVYCVR